MPAQYRLPEASEVFRRRLRRLKETNTSYTITTRREDSPWVLVRTPDGAR